MSQGKTRQVPELLKYCGVDFPTATSGSQTFDCPVIKIFSMAKNWPRLRLCFPADYMDFCSLYPTIQYYQKYPTGHPTKIFNPEKYGKSWYGIIKVVAPKGLYHSVLPQRIKVDSYENQSSDILQHSQNRPTGDRWLKFKNTTIQIIK